MKFNFQKNIKKCIFPNWFFPILIFLITSLIAFKNFVPNTYLTGWDNLHPEFDFKLNIARSLSSAWQQYQGVGLLGGMAHAADLPRQLFLWLVSIILPINLIRYFWTFLMLFLGPLGVYFLVLQELNSGSSLLRGPRSQNASARSSASAIFTLVAHSKIAAFTASIFYIFNLATVQYFFVPFETFVGFYGFLPWMILYVLKYLRSGDTKVLFKYFVISIFATTAFYVQTLFLVYLIFVFVFCIFAIFKKFRLGVKRSFLILLVTVMVNGFWLFPVSWFGLTSGSIPINSQINKIASPETVYINLARNSFEDISLNKGYWFDYYDFQADQEFDYLFKDWIDWTQKPYIKEIGIGLFIVGGLGLLLAGQIEWLVLLGVSYVLLSGFVPDIPILKEAFRNSFTKWSVALSFVISVGIGQFVSKFRKISVVPALLVISASIYITFPILNGKLIADRVRIEIPSEYMQMFDWFNDQTSGERAAFFPAFDKWGWNYHEWGYGGSGFIWYGVKNPILDRAFNVWSSANESYYNQITKAILNEDVNVFENTLEKYQVRHLIIDDSVVFPWGDKDLLKVDVINNFTSDLGYKKVFNSGFLSVYDTHISTSNFISSPESYVNINADLTYSQVDPIFGKYGDYVQSSDTTFPFVNFDPRSEVQVGQKLDEAGQSWLTFKNASMDVTADAFVEEKLTETFEEGHGFDVAKNCDLKENGNVERKQLESGREYKAFDGGVACDYFVFSDIASESAHVLHITGENKKGRSLKIYLYDWISKRVVLEELLPESKFDEYFVVYSGSEGYTLNVETRSFGKVLSENEINTIELIPFDVEVVSNLSLGKRETEIVKNNLVVNSVQKYGTWGYKVDVEGSGLLQLGQGYEDGWVAWQITPEESPWNTVRGALRLEHVKVNSWSNGWLVPDSDENVYIIFWPQLLEWFGFLVLGITFFVLLSKIKNQFDV